ncbi:MAG TPA: Coenzyme F420 hydrogenase/dehydrogenase, beta subunit C-terminal domain [Actinomycetota bacterium]|jgi:coenzyme F420 hydrogenase subunit beta|nr:Coenzyme F420 hydrogenase/dehydrogenase, beta subunit C-terminal domain [Actinomycetota bacterium]
MEKADKTQWRELYHEVVETNLCTGCAACVMACPRDVLEYDHSETYHPYNVELSTAFDDCVHGQRGCDICTRACPRFRAWEPECDEALFGRARQPDEITGISRGVWLVRATDPEVLDDGQDGGLVSALLIWGLEHDRIEGALTSRLSSTRLGDCEPFLATTRQEVLEAAGSRYTYAANPLAMRQAEERGLKRLALVGMSCQASINGTLNARRLNKYARRILLTIGLLCSKSFEYDGLRRVLTEDYGIPLEDVAKVNIKGRFQVWRRSTGELVEIPLKRMQEATRAGCKLCPDFAAEHADISVGGLGQRDGWTLTVVRTQRGEEWLEGASQDGVVTVRPGAEDPPALALMGKLAVRSRQRWPAELAGDGLGAPAMLPIVQTT